MMPTAGRGLDIVIVSYRCRERLRDCLASLERHGASVPMHVCVVDNHSEDGTVEMVLAHFPDVSLEAAQANLGFARATNLGIRRGTAPYVLVLNPDTRLYDGTLDLLIELMDESPEIGIAGPKLIREDGSFDHAARRSFPTPLGALGHFLLVGRRRGGGRLAQYRAPNVERGPVDAVNGAFMLIRRRTLDEVGLFDEGYWMYMEDLDLCFRCRQAGWVTWYEPDGRAVHVKGASGRRTRSPRLVYAFHYGMFRFYRAHYAAHRSKGMNGLTYAGITIKLGVALMRSTVGRLARGAS